MDVRFYISSQAGKSGESQIIVSLSTNGVRVKTSTGYKIDPKNWDAKSQRVKRGTQNQAGLQYNVVNAALDRTRAHFGAMDDVSRRFTKDELAEEYRAFRGISQKQERGEGEKGADAAGGHSVRSLLIKFTAEQGGLNGWSESTFKKFKTLGNHLETYRRDMRAEDINEDALNGFVAYLLRQGFNNNYIKKLTKTMAWFLRWCQKKGYCANLNLECLSPRLKTPERHVIYLEWDELMAVYNFDIPEDRAYLSRVRDAFCFCCFTGLRFSDMQNLKRSDVYYDSISISTIKTSERLEIPLSVQARAILDKYASDDMDGKALPSIPNQKLNEHLKELCRLCGIDRPVTVVDFHGSRRTEEVKQKWELVGSHCGRRTFISNALAMGVPVTTVMAITGHSDLHAMKPYIEIAERAKREAIKVFDTK